MHVHIKKFDVNMDVKASGIEFEVRKRAESAQIGDCYLTMTGLIWCKGRTDKKNGINLSWEDFMAIMKSEAAKKAALKGAKAIP
jgi:hypothetical protein